MARVVDDLRKALKKCLAEGLDTCTNSLYRHFLFGGFFSSFLRKESQNGELSIILLELAARFSDLPGVGSCRIEARRLWQSRGRTADPPL